MLWHEDRARLLARRISQLCIEESTTESGVTVTRTQKGYSVGDGRRVLKYRQQTRIVIEEDDMGKLIKTRQRETVCELARRMAEDVLAMDGASVPIPVKKFACGVEQPPLFAAI